MSDKPVGKHAYSHMYKSRRWKQQRMRQLTKDPLCAYCLRMGKVSPALVADHIKPHRGNEALFWDSGNLQSLCFRCHNSSKQIEERADKNKNKGNDVDGMPNDPSHHWYSSP